MELSNYFYFPAEIAREKHKKLQSAGVIHVFLEATAQAIPPWHCGCCLLRELGLSSSRLVHEKE